MVKKRIYRIKTSEFTNLTSNQNLLTESQKSDLDQLKKLLGVEPKKFLGHGENIVLIIGQDNKYYITSKKCYRDSLVKILESVKIDNNSIVILNRSSDSDSQELSIAQLKNFLIDDDDESDESDESDDE